MSKLIGACHRLCPPGLLLWTALLGANAPALAETDCPGGDVASFVELAERLEEYDEITVLGAELLVSPTRACRETWVVEILNDDDEVRALLLDARTLEVRFVGGGDEIEHGDEDDDIHPVLIDLRGGDTSDWIEGDWSDDRMRGGGGRDLFVATPGSDIIADFTPGTDVLDLGDFARREDGFGVLRSMADLRRLSRTVREDGQTGLQIDTDGESGDWSVTLLGLRKGDLSQSDVFFGLREDSAPGLEPTHWPARRIELSNGTVAEFGAYAIDAEPPDGKLLRGDPDGLEMLRGILFDLFEAQRDEED